MRDAEFLVRNGYAFETTMPRTKSYRYDPQPDITLYELARALPYMHIGLSFSGQKYIELFLMDVGTAIRHFKEQS